MGRSKLLCIEDRVFDRERVRRIGIIFLCFEAAVFVWTILAGHSLVGGNGEPRWIDFGTTWISGGFALSPHPASLYRLREYATAVREFFPSVPNDPNYFHLSYPPTLMLFSWPLWLMPYFIAFGAWLVATFALFYLAGRQILPGPAAFLLPASIPFAVIINAQLGQNGFLTAGLIGLCLALLNRRPVAAGIILGALSFKPQFGVLFPMALALGRYWRAFIAAAITTSVLAVAAAAAFGGDVWSAQLATLATFDSNLNPDAQIEILHQSAFGWLHWAGATPIIAWAVQIVATMVVIVIVGIIWFRPGPYALKAAALSIGAVAATPYVLTYDLCVLAIALAFFLRDAIDRGFLPGERTLLLLLFLVSLMLAKPIAPVLYLGLFILVIRRRTYSTPQTAPAATASLA